MGLIARVEASRAGGHMSPPNGPTKWCPKHPSGARGPPHGLKFKSFALNHVELKVFLTEETAEIPGWNEHPGGPKGNFNQPLPWGGLNYPWGPH